MFIGNFPCIKDSVYIDEGISGTSTKRRRDFQRLILDCRAGKVDIVITKSISRFARNTKDCLDYMRELRSLGIPIIFEKENINSMEAGGELLFTILSSLAQDESRNISENCKWGIRSKFKNGELHLNTYKFLGYDKDGNGKLVINEDQAKTVRRIYKEFLEGKNPQEIAKTLEDEGIPGCIGQTKWYPSTVVGILKNEKHKGDALLQKTYTSDFLTKKQVKNHGEIQQVYIEDNHEGIIDKETWEIVQEELSRRDAFMKAHGLKMYVQGSEPTPFTCKVFCGKCGTNYTRHARKSTGIVQWQCKNHRTEGVLTCDNRHVSEDDLKQGFVIAFNSLYEVEDKFLTKKKEQVKTGTLLEKFRANQMIELLREPPLGDFVPELAQLILEAVIVHGSKEFEYRFLDGTIRKVSV